jgi:NAD(P)H-hydrate repair Nnr-like enzyme with NAD(P)H-hydrate dehydratase domain
MKPSYWHTQDPANPLFPDIEWSKPEQKSLAGSLLIIGGNKLGFAAVATAYESALKAGIGQCRVVLPDVLKKSIDSSTFDCVFAASNPSGGFSKDAIGELKAYMAWADGVLFIGESGRNAETAIAYEQLLGIDRHIILTRDALDLVRRQASQWLENPQLCAVATFAQLQKIFQEVHYPKMLLFRMQLAQLVEALHKFTITYPAKIVTLHQGQLIVAHDGEVSTTPCEDNLVIWRGLVATRAGVYVVQHPAKQFEALTSAVVTKQ